MTQTAYPFNDVQVYEDEWRPMARLWRPSGVIPLEGNSLAVQQRAAGAAMQVDVQTGLAFIVGHYYENDAVVELPIVAPVANPRIDTIVVEFDFVAGTRILKVVQGAEAAVPAAPALTQNLTVKWQFALWDIYNRVGEVSIKTASDGVNGYLLADRRIYSNPGAGVLAQAKVTANQAAISTGPTDLTGLTKTINVPAGRRLKITGTVVLRNGTGAVNAAHLYVYKDGAQIQDNEAGLTSFGAGVAQTIPVYVTDDPAAGEHTYKLAAGFGSGPGNSLQAAANQPAIMVIEDIGAAIP
jgi:hypothetical protein